MHVNTATSLISTLNQHRNPNQPILDELHRLFSPTLFGKGIVLRSSLKGRVTDFLSQRIGDKTKQNKVRTVFAQVLQTLEKQPVQLNGLTGTVLELENALKKTNFRVHNYQLPRDTQAPDERDLEKLISCLEEKTTAGKEEIRNFSLLHNAEMREGTVKEEAFLPVIRGQYNEHSSDYLTNYLDANPQAAIANYKDRLEQIRQSKSTAEKIKSEYLQGTREIPQIADGCLRDLQQLNPGESWMFCGGYGQKIGSLNSIFRAIKMLPEAFRKNLPRPFSELLENPELPDPVEFAKTELHNALLELAPMLPDLQKYLGNDLVSPFFQNDQRQLPWLLANALPRIVTAPIESWIKEGILKQISAFVPQDGLSDIIDWIATNQQTFISDTQRGSAIRELEDRLARELKGPVEGAMDKVDASLLTLLQGFQKTFHPSLLELLGLDSLFSSGDLWIQFTKQNDGLFTLSVYASGPALKLHTKSGDKISWPLRFENVQPSKLDTNFLHSLLTHYLAPLKNPEANSRAEHIYNELFDYLEVKPSAPKEEFLVPDQPIKDELALTLAALLKPEAPSAILNFQMKLDALVQYCKKLGFGEDGLLEVKNSETAGKLELAIQVLWDEAQPFEEVLGKEGMRRLTATRDEVLRAIEKHKQEEAVRNIVLPGHALVIPRKLLEQIQKMLNNTGLSTESIRNVKGALCWAFGDEIESVIDTVIESLELLPKSEIPAAQKSGNQGILRRIVSSIYVKVLYHAVQAAWLAHRLYTGEATGLLIATWGHWCLKQILPKPFSDWYEIVIDTVIETIGKAFIWLILQLLSKVGSFSKEEMVEFMSTAKKWQHALTNWTRSLNATHQVEYDYDEKINNDTPKEIATDATKVAFMVEAAAEKNNAQLYFIDNHPVNTTADALGRLRSLKAEPDVHTPGYVLQLLNIAEALTIPLESSYWDKLDKQRDMVDAMSALSDLAVQLHNSLPHTSQHPELVSRTIVALYSTLAISDKLAHRAEPTLKGYTINAFPFLAFLKGNGVQLTDPKIQQRARDICSYFMPDIDLDKVPDDPYTDPAILQRVKNSLFDYSTVHSLKYLYKTEILPEAAYLKQRLEKGHLETKLIELGMNPKAKFRTKLNVLFNESLVFGRDINILPRAYCNLKLHTLLANRAVIYMGSEHTLAPCTIKKKEPPTNDVYSGMSFDTNMREWYEWYKKPTNHPLVPSKLPEKNSTFTANEKHWDTFKKGVKTQAEIISAEKGRFILSEHDTPRAQEISKAYESIFVEKDDQALRAIGFLNKYINELPDDPRKNSIHEPLESAFFGFDILNKQLTRSPHTAAAMADFIRVQFERQFAEKRYDWCLWLIRIGIKLERFTNKTDVQFPNFREAIQKVIDTQDPNTFSPLMGDALQLQALTCNGSDHETVFALVRGMFYPAKTNNNQDFNEKYGVWLETINAYLTNSPERESIFLALLKDRCVRRSGSELNPKEKFVFEFSDFTFNIQNGSIESPLRFLMDNFNILKDKACQYAPEASNLLIGTQGFEDEKGHLKIVVNQDENSFEISKTLQNEKYNHLSENERSKRYKLITSELPETFLPLADFNPDLLKQAKCWLEESTSRRAARLLLIEIPGKPAILIHVQMNRNEPNVIAQVYACEDKMIAPVASRQFGHSVAPINRFCALNNMLGWAAKASKKLEYLYLKPYKLFFKAQTVDGILQLNCSSHFPNYHIAAQQQHKALEGISSYLLLENDNKGQKVLLPEGQWLTSGANGLLPKMGLEGSLARALEKWFGNMQQKNIHGDQTFYSFDLDTQGNLNSEDPKALLYLTSLYLIQGNNEAERVANELLRVIRLQRSPVDLSHQLLLLSTVPSSVSNVSRIRRRILAAVEENKALHDKGETKEGKVNRDSEKSRKVLFESLIMVNTCLNDLKVNSKEAQSRFKLSESHELYLYEHLFRHAKIMLEQGIELPDTVIKNLDNFGWDTVMLSLGFSAELAQRYTMLRKKHNKHSSLTNVTLRILAKSVRMNPGLPSINVLGSGMVPAMFKDGLNAVKTAATNYVFSLKPLKINELATHICAAIVPKPPLEISQLNQEAFIAHFASYYNIAKGYGTREQSAQLKRLLQTGKGGWDESTNMLANFLSAVQTAPFIYQKTEKLTAILAIENPNDKLAQLTLFFETISFRATSSEHLKHAASFACHGAYNVVHKTVVHGAMGLPSLLWANIMMNGAARVTNAIMSEMPPLEASDDPASFMPGGFTPVQPPVKPTAVVKKPLPAAPKNVVNYTSLSNIDTFIDNVLNDIISKGFNKVSATSVPTMISRFEGKDEINNSLDAYKSEASKAKDKYQYKGEKQLWDMYIALSSFRDQMTAKSKEQLEIILKTVNSKTIKDKVTFADLKKALIQDNLPILCKELGLSQAETASVELATMRYAVLQTRLNQINRAMAAFDKLSTINAEKNPGEYLKQLDTIVKETAAKRQYKFVGMDKRTIRRFVFFELLTDTLLWLRQASPIAKVLATDEGNHLILLLMALGKTFFGLPTMASGKADGKHIVFMTAPDTLAETTLRQTSQQGGTIYDQATNLFPIERSSQHNIKFMEAINGILGRALTEGETINLLMTEGQALEANFIDLHYLAKRTGNQDGEIFVAQELHRAAIEQIQNKGVIIGDEAALLNQPNRELNHPLGNAYTIKKSYQLISELCMQELLKHPAFLKAMQDNDLENFPADKYFKEVARPAAEAISKLWYFKFKNEDERKEFVDYISGEMDKKNNDKDSDATIPEWITSSEQFEEMSLAKGTLCTLVPLLLDLNVNRDYGRSSNEEAASQNPGNVKKYAGPFSGHMDPNVKCDIQLCYENLIKSYSTYLHTGLYETESAQLLIKLLAIAKEEQKLRKVNFSQTSVYTTLSSILPIGILEKLDPDCSNDIKKQAVAVMMNHHEAIILYIRFYVVNTIRYWKRCNTTDAQNFFSMFKSRNVATGTNYNEGSNHPSLSPIKPPEIKGEAIQLLSQVCDDKCIHVLEASEPLKVLHETLSNYFADSTFSILCDGDAQLKGLDNETVVKEMEKHCKIHRPEIKAIVYTTRLNGKDQLVYREIGSTEPHPFDQCKIKPENYLVYLDENHGSGINVPVVGSLFILYGKQPLFELLQQSFRLRVIVKSFSLLLNGKMMEMAKASAPKAQKIHIAMTKQTRDRLTNAQNRQPTLHEVVDDADNSEDKLVKKEYYQSYRKQIRDIVRSNIMHKLAAIQDVRERNKIFAEFEEFLVPVIPDEPSKLFGRFQFDLDTATALKIARKRNFSYIGKSSFFSKEEKEAIRKAIDNLPVPPMPPTVKAFRNGKDIEVDTLDNIGILMNVENTVDQNVNNDVNIDVQTSDNTPSIFTETEWSTDIYYGIYDWLTFKDAAYKDKIERILDLGLSYVKKAPVMPYLFRFQNALSNTNHTAIQGIASIIDKRLWFTNNFIPRCINGILGEPIDAGSKHQRELYEVLVTFDENGAVTTVGALSQHDSKFWRERLEKGPENNMVVYDIPSGKVVSGPSDLSQKLKTDANFPLLEVQMKFLNGDSDYTKEQIIVLRNWLQSNKDQINTLYNGYHLIHDQRSTVTASGSVIEEIFNDLRGIPARYRL